MYFVMEVVLNTKIDIVKQMNDALVSVMSTFDKKSGKVLTTY